MTKGEKALFGQYQRASLKFELAIAQRIGGGLSGWKARAMREAADLLDAANRGLLFRHGVTRRADAAGSGFNRRISATTPSGSTSSASGR